MLRFSLPHFHLCSKKNIVIIAMLLTTIVLALLVHASRKAAINEALYNGVKMRNVEAVREALASGADANMMADARGQHPALLRSLLFWRDRDPQSHSVPILMAALSYSNGNEYNPDPANDPYHNPATPFRPHPQIAKMLEIVQILLKHGAHVDAVGSYGQTALTIASADSAPQLVACLLDNGADINHRTVAQFSPLYNTACYSDTRTARLLLQRGADPNIRLGENENGDTPLMMAVLNDNEEMSVLLLKAGARVTLIDRDGNTVLKYDGLDSFSPATRHLFNLSLRRELKRK